MDPRSWTVFKGQAGHVSVPLLDPGEAQAQLTAEHFRRRAEREAEQAQLQGELERYQALVDAGLEHYYQTTAPIETHIRDVDQTF